MKKKVKVKRARKYGEFEPGDRVRINGFWFVLGTQVNDGWFKYPVGSFADTNGVPVSFSTQQQLECASSTPGAWLKAFGEK